MSYYLQVALFFATFSVYKSPPIKLLATCFFIAGIRMCDFHSLTAATGIQLITRSVDYCFKLPITCISQRLQSKRRRNRSLPIFSSSGSGFRPGTCL